MTSTIPDIRIAGGLFVKGSGITKIDVDVLGEKIGGGRAPQPSDIRAK
jgi:hypothetical protein